MPEVLSKDELGDIHHHQHHHRRFGAVQNPDLAAAPAEAQRRQRSVVVSAGPVDWPQRAHLSPADLQLMDWWRRVQGQRGEPHHQGIVPVRGLPGVRRRERGRESEETRTRGRAWTCEVVEATEQLRGLQDRRSLYEGRGIDGRGRWLHGLRLRFVSLIFVVASAAVGAVPAVGALEAVPRGTRLLEAAAASAPPSAAAAVVVVVVAIIARRAIVESATAATAAAAARSVARLDLLMLGSWLGEFDRKRLSAEDIAVHRESLLGRGAVRIFDEREAAGEARTRVLDDDAVRHDAELREEGAQLIVGHAAGEVCARTGGGRAARRVVRIRTWCGCCERRVSSLWPSPLPTPRAVTRPS